MNQVSSQQVEQLSGALARWGELWGISGLETGLTVELSNRLRTTLGRCIPRERRILLASFLLEGPSEVFQEVVCHEAAHAAVYELHGNGPKPHGAEWKALMRMAGYEPRARIRWKGGYEGIVKRIRSRALWEHRCPVCQAYRIARRPVRNWRCAACHAAGLPGRLVVTRIAGTSGGAS